MSHTGIQLSSAAKNDAKVSKISARKHGSTPIPAVDSSDWHDQIKSASRLLAMAMDRLGLEGPSPLYKKVSSAVFPPFKASLNYIHGQIGPDPVIVARETEIHEDEDVAFPVSEHHGSMSILSMLASASACAGATSLKAIGSILHDRYKDDEEEDNGGKIVGDDTNALVGDKVHKPAPEVGNFDPDDEQLNENQEYKQSVSKTTEVAKQPPKPRPSKRPSSRNVRLRRTVTSAKSVGKPRPPSLRKTSTLPTLTGTKTDEQKHAYSCEIMAKALTNADYTPPPENLRSKWENSVMDNLLLHPTGEDTKTGLDPGSETALDAFKVSEGVETPGTSETVETTETPETAETAATSGSLQTIKAPETVTAPDSSKTDIIKYHIALKLKDTFDFDDENYLLDHFDVWLMKDVFLQGHIYVTKDAVCFYSLLPGKFSDTELNDPELTLHSGALGHKLAHYGDAFFSSVYTNQFWAVLKPQTLSIYTSPTKLYFPVRTIDLRNAVSCEISESSSGGINLLSPLTSPNFNSTPTEPSVSQLASEMSSMAEEDPHDENVQSGVWFKINCTDKSYRFYTSSIYSARHWYNCISKVIFSLHNTNQHREVLVRLPVEDIVDYKTNFVLSDAEALDSQDPDDDDAPMSFSIKFNLPPTVDDSKLQKLKVKTDKIGHPNPLLDSVHFVAFNKGKDLDHALERVLHEDPPDTVSRNHAFRRKAKHLFREDHSDMAHIHSRSDFHVVSTMQPEHSSSQSVIDKIVEVNAKIFQAREKELSKLTEDAANDLSDSAPDGDSKKFSYVPNFKVMKDKLLPKSSTIGSIATIGDGILDMFRPEDDTLMPQQDFEISDFDHHLQLPKPFSLKMLKNLDIQMVRKRRTFEDIANQYGNLSELVKAKLLEENALCHKKHAMDMITNNHTDSDASAKHGKLRSIKNSIKTFSTMGGVWSAKPEHYDPILCHDKYYVNSNRDRARAVSHFRDHFSLGPESQLVSTYYAHLKRTVPVFGRLYIGRDQLCFRSLIPGVSTKMVVPLRDIQNCKKQTRLYQYSGLVVKIRGLEDLQLAFGSKEARDDGQKMILKLLKKEDFFNPDTELHEDGDSVSSTDLDENEEQRKKTDELANSRVHAARLRLLEDKISYSTGIDIPLILEDDPITKTEVQLTRSYKITLLTIGSRGDVQPYIALGKALVKEGHIVTIATHAEFEDWVSKYGIHFREIAGDPAELMQLMVTHGSISVAFLKEASTKFRGWIGELLETSWKACQGAELLIESPSAMAGLHIAEALNIPYMRAFTMPWTRTRAYPHAFLVPDQNRGGSYNFLTHVMFENVFWKGISGQVNRWRSETLGLPRTSLVKMQQTRVPFLYNVSPAMFPPAVDFPDWVKVTGYWFLDEGSKEYEPPKELVKFLDTAKDNGEMVVYIGFGSIVVSDAKALTKTIVEAVLDSGVKCILNKGWSDKLSKSKGEPEIKLPPQIYNTGAIPHDWLFTKIDAAVHHGGSGTTGATLRAGLPTIIKPFFGDQFFFAARVEDLGVGVSLKHLNKKSFTKALKSITSEQKYSDKAMEISKAMSHERGVLSAVEAIYTELAYSKSLISVIRHGTDGRKQNDDKAQATAIDEEAFDMINESKDDESSEDQMYVEQRG